MNQKGEVTLLSCLLIFCLMSVVLLSALELQKSYKLLQKRTHLFLCVKETKGELHEYIKFMGRTNWAIQNIKKAQIIMLLIPGTQGIAMDAEKLKKYLQYIQEGRTVSYLKTLNDLRNKSCPLDPRMIITPFKLGARVLQREVGGGAILRENKWTYGYFSKPYFLTIEVDASGWESMKPHITYTSEEKLAKLSSLLSSR